MHASERRRSNQERSASTRAALLEAGRELFVGRAYAEIGTPELAQRAKVTRGALYHHFADKRALFRAVVEAEAAAVADEIERASAEVEPPLEALKQGGEAFLSAMSRPGRTRLLLLDAPAVLGRAELDAIDALHGARTLREGLTAAMRAGTLRELPLDTAAHLLSAAYDRAALAIEAGASPNDCRTVLEALLDGLSARGCAAP